MKLQISSWMFALVLSLTLIVISSPTFAYYHPSYNFDNRVLNYSNPRWMADIDDNVRLSLLTIPGTNASASRGKGGSTHQTQIMTIPSQLDAGIRYFDFGVFKENSHDMSLYLYYNRIYLDHNLSYPLTKFKEFLEKNPSETIIMHVSQENSTHNDTVIFNCLQNYIKQFSNSIWHGDNFSEMNFNPPLGEIRGKIVLFYPHFLKDQTLYSFSDLYNMQPPAYFLTNWDLYDKWLSSQDFIFNTKYKGNIPITTPSILYLADKGWALPCFVASGHGSCDNNASQLSTGFTTPGFKSYYPDFPRTACFMGICTISFKGLNMLWADKIANRFDLPSLGIIAVNFPGAGFIDAMIAMNRFHAKTALLTGKFFKIAPTFNSNYVLDINTRTNQVVLWSHNGNKNQQWYFEHVGNGSYLIKSMHDEDLLLSVNTLWSTSNDLVVRKYQVGDELQKWTLQRFSNHFFILVGPYGLPIHVPDYFRDGSTPYTSQVDENSRFTYQTTFYIHPTLIF